MADSFDAVILGADPNGLVAAAYLARAGHRVLVVDAGDVPGGVVATLEFAPGFRASVGPDLGGGVPPQVAADLDLGRHGLEWLPLDPLVFVRAPDGRHLTLSPEPDATLAAIGALSSRDAAAYPAFADLVGRIAGFLRSLVGRKAPDPSAESARDLIELARIGLRFRRLGRADVHETLRVLPTSIADFLNERFELDLLKAALAVQGLHGVALGPRSAGTTAIFLLHQLGASGWPRVAWRLPRGGMGAVSRALAGAATANGAHFRTRAKMAGILVRDNRAVGVLLESGEEIAARAVVSSLDPGTTFLRLLEPGAVEPEFQRDVQRIRYRGVTARLLLALDRLPPLAGLSGDGPQPQHRGVIQIGHDLDYLERAYDATKYGRCSERPWLDVVVPTLSDPDLAPPGKHVMSVTAQYAPFALRDGTWADHADRFADGILATLEDSLPGVTGSVVRRCVITPLDFQETYGLPEGSLHQGELALDQLLFMRPVAGWSGYRTPVEGLYLCGACTHPGGTVLGASGHNASRVVLGDLKSQSPA